jgi:ribosomal protein S18 acetylase RimI-like enzyme
VLAPDRVLERRDGYAVVRSPSNPTYHWGNLLLFDEPPRAGDGTRWEALFAAAFDAEPEVRHRTFAWDRADGDAGAAREEFVDRGYDFEDLVGLVAERLASHPRENRDVVVRSLDPAAGADEALWAAVVELQVALRRVGEDEERSRTFSRRRLEELRTLFRAGRGSWYVALDPVSGDVAGSCGVVVAGGRGRFQLVGTAAEYQRRGVCSRLVVEAARCARDDHGAGRLVIVADANYHALGLYESLGFERRERVSGICLWPRTVP